MTLAQVHSELPRDDEGHHQEYRLALDLRTLDDAKLHLWFSLNYLQGVNDIDLLIWHEDAGVFVVEVKGVRIQDFLSYGLGTCEIVGRGKGQAPTGQALKAMYALMNYLKGGTAALPFMVSTACFPRIKRYEWKKQWSDATIRALGDYMLFQEDIVGGAEALRARLCLIASNPPVGKPSLGFRHSAAGLKYFIDSLNVTAKPLPTPSELERLRRIERRVREEVRKEYPSGTAYKITFRGHPGTGKTFRLLEIGVAHVLDGLDVLFVCFNKVLASDIRRLLSFSETLAGHVARIEVADAFELITPWAAQYGVSVDEASDYDEWASLVVDALAAENPAGLPSYDTILVDEAQDLPEWLGRYLSLVRRAAGSTFVADGPGQELYGLGPAWLKTIRAGAREVQLRRNFRNTRPAFIAAQAYYEVATDTSKLDAFVARFRAGAKQEAAQLSLGFERPEGLPPRVLRVNEDRIWLEGESSPFFPDVQQEVMVAEIARLVKDEIQELRDDQYPIDLLVLVPDKRSVTRQWTKLALESAGVAFIDYTEDERRRDAPRREQVRFCTFHSARGIEALRVLLIGFDNLEAVAVRAKCSPNNLGYIVLSRALLATTLVANRHPAASVKFVEDAVGRIARL